MKWRPDVRLSWTTTAWSPAQHLRINNGVEIRRRSRFETFLRDADSGWATEASYHGVYQARCDWRPLTEAETADAIGLTDGDDAANTVWVFEAPAALIGAARTLADACSASGDYTPKPLTGARQIHGPAMSPLLPALRDWLHGEVCLPFDFGCDYGPFLRINPKGRTSATGHRQRSWDGLHVDNWGIGLQRQADRRYHGARFVLNVGRDVRHFIYINQRLATMAQHDAAALPADLMTVLRRTDCVMPSLTAAAFIEAFPAYPVLRVSLPPGFGYVANSVCIPHDGDLAGMQDDDIALLVPHKLDPPTGTADAALRYRPDWLARNQALSGPVHR